jgi:hypothetical protein
MRLLPHEPGYPGELDAAGLAAILDEAEAGGLLSRETYRDKERKAKQRWALTSAGMAFVGGGALVVGGDVAQPARKQALPAEETSARVAAGEPAHVLQVAQDGLLDASTAREAEVLAALAQACEETGVAHREDWLARFSAGRAAVGVDELTAIREFGVAIRALRAAGRVVVAGEFAWVA